MRGKVSLGIRGQIERGRCGMWFVMIVVSKFCDVNNETDDVREKKDGVVRRSRIAGNP